MMIEDIRTQLSLVLGSIATVDYPVASLPTTRLPAAILLLDSLSAEPRGVGGMKYAFTFRVELVIMPVAQSKGDDVIRDAESKLESAVNALLANPTLNGSVDHLERVESDGVHVLSLGGTDYYSALFRVAYIVK